MITGDAVLAAALTAASAWTAVQPTRYAARRPVPRPVRRRATQWLIPALVVIVALLAWGRAGIVWAVAAILVAATVLKVGGDHLRRSRRRGRGQEVAEASRALAGRLSVGDVPAVALEALAEEHLVLAPARRAQQVGADVPRALLVASAVPGQESLGGLARAWRMSELTGAPLASATSTVAGALRRRTRLEATLEAELAGPRASGRLMGLLPLAGIAMAQMVGAQPAEFLLGSWPGRLCALAAVGLSCLGVLWSESIADRVHKEVLP